MAEGNPSWGPALGQGTVSFQLLVTTLQNNMLQFSALLQDLTAAVQGISNITIVAAPATSASPGAAGQVAMDATHFYFWTNGQWLRVVGAVF